MPYPNKKFTIEHDSWDEPAVEQAWAPAPYEPTRAYAVYAASKTQTEQALWKFVKEQKPGYVLNTGMTHRRFFLVADLITDSSARYDTWPSCLAKRPGKSFHSCVCGQPRESNPRRV